LNSNSFTEKDENSTNNNFIDKNLNEITFEDVIFNYPGNKNFLLNIKKLKIKKGEVIGITGKSGHGKSTFLNIFTGLLQTSSGKISFNDHLMTLADFKILQKKIAYVPQNIFILDETIKKNIAFGIEDKLIDKEKVRQACKIAGLADFIEHDLQDKYDTIVGENAIKLSGGQRQRIGIARAIYDDKEILILDEATNALDEEKAGEIIDKISSIKNITIILVTHNPIIIKKLSKVLHFDKGNLAL